MTELTDIDIIKMLIKSPETYIQDYRVANDDPFVGLLIPCSWDLKDRLREILLEALDHWTTTKENQK